MWSAIIKMFDLVWVKKVGGGGVFSIPEVGHVYHLLDTSLSIYRGVGGCDVCVLWMKSSVIGKGWWDPGGPVSSWGDFGTHN